MDKIREKKGYICDMDGVIYHGNRILPGVVEFVNWLYEKDKKFLFLTNNSGKTPRQLHEKLAWMGLQVDESHFYTSAQATADFIARQMPGAHVAARPPAIITTISAVRYTMYSVGHGSLPPIRTSPAPPNRALFRPAGHWSSPLRWSPDRRPITSASPIP